MGATEASKVNWKSDQCRVRLLLLLPGPLSEANGTVDIRTRDLFSPNNNWNVPGNWQDSTPPTDVITDEIVFRHSFFPTSNYLLNTLTFEDVGLDAPSYTIGGTG